MYGLQRSALYCRKLQGSKRENQNGIWGSDILNDTSGSTVQEKLGALKYENGNLEAQWTNIKKYVLDTTGDLVVKVDRRARKPWITQYMISTMDE
jgi:hypothetical protein